MIDFYALALRSLDEPLQGDDRDALRVWADYLQTSGDPTGMLIALEHAIVDQPSRRRELEQEIKLHLLAVGRALLGEQLASIVTSAQRDLELEWRSGLVRAIFLDLRYRRHLLELVLTSQLTRLLRRLEMRVRRTNLIPAVSNVLTAAKLPALEELVMMPGVRPTRLGTPTYSPHPLANAFETLRLLVIDDAIVPLDIDRETIKRLSEVAPSRRIDRMLLGRCLTCADADLRVQALERVEALGPGAAVFVDTLMLLLAPGMPVPQALVIRALAAIGTYARRALPQLAVITGRPTLYNEATRKAAGSAIHALRP